MTIWHCDTLDHLVGTLDMGLIKDEANVVAPCRCRRIEVPPLSENSADTVELAQGADQIALESADPTPASSSHATNRAPNSLRSMPSSGALVPLAQIQKLEAQMPLLSTIYNLGCRNPLLRQRTT